MFAADATSMVHRWDFSGSSVTTGGLRLVANPGKVRKERERLTKQMTRVIHVFYCFVCSEFFQQAVIAAHVQNIIWTPFLTFESIYMILDFSTSH